MNEETKEEIATQPVDSKESIPQSEAEVLRNAMITSSSRFFAYYYDNRDNIGKNDLFKVFIEVFIRSFNIEFPAVMKKFLFNDETATEHMKNLLAMGLHLFDIKHNKIVRESLTEWKENYLTENKGEKHE